MNEFFDLANKKINELIIELSEDGKRITDNLSNEEEKGKIALIILYYKTVLQGCTSFSTNISSLVRGIKDCSMDRADVAFILDQFCESNAPLINLRGYEEENTNDSELELNPFNVFDEDMDKKAMTLKSLDENETESKAEEERISDDSFNAFELAPDTDVLELELNDGEARANNNNDLEYKQEIKLDINNDTNKENIDDSEINLIPDVQDAFDSISPVFSDTEDDLDIPEIKDQEDKQHENIPNLDFNLEINFDDFNFE